MVPVVIVTLSLATLEETHEVSLGNALPKILSVVGRKRCSLAYVCPYDSVRNHCGRERDALRLKYSSLENDDECYWPQFSNWEHYSKGKRHQ